jgi:cellulose synthase/poly-beta-1,6-N-acetylglucosamine synthase-like glycosyltransferase
LSVSIIVTCEEQEQQLRKVLPQLLSQQYGSDYEVIVVDKKHDKDLEEWLEEMEAQYSYLSHTFCPASSRGIDLQKLALTLGAKSANYEWLVILPVETELLDENWLKSLMSGIDEQADITIASKLVRSKVKMAFFRLRLRFAKYIRLQFLFRRRTALIVCRRSILLQIEPRILKQRVRFEF